jgi:hypothetical protein
MVGIICLIIGILGFVKGRINVSARRELRGSGMYIVATLFCLPLPLSFLIGAAISAMNAANPKPGVSSSVFAIAAACTWLPILLGIILAFVMATPKAAPTGVPVQGFPVMPPAPSGPQGPIVPPHA